MIVSFLPTKDGARTQILASPWRHLWRSAPLNLDTHGLAAHGVDDPDLAPLVSRILSSHLGPGRRFRVSKHHLESRSDTPDAWLRSPALAKLEELEYFFFYHPPPASVFGFSRTLRALMLGNCTSPDDTVQGLHFPELKRLGLETVHISQCSLQSLIQGCPALESLLMQHCVGFHRVRISSPTVRSIAVYEHAQDLFIDNAPRLQRLVLIDVIISVHVSAVAAPKLDTVGFLSDMYYRGRPDHRRLVFGIGSTVIQGLRVDGLATAVRTVKILAISMITLCLDTVVELLECFPCLEKLYIKKLRGCMLKREPTNLWRRKHQNLIESNDIRLKTIVLSLYWGIKSEVNFVTFFVLNARMLETMTLQLETSYYNEEFLAEQRTKLQLQNRASGAAQIRFTTDTCIRSSSDVQHVHDLDVVDPFKAPS